MSTFVPCLPFAQAFHDVVVVFTTMRHGAGTAVLDTRAVGRFDVDEVAAAVLAKSVQGTVAKEAVKLLGWHVVARVELAGSVVEELVILGFGHMMRGCHVDPFGAPLCSLVSHLRAVGTCGGLRMRVGIECDYLAQILLPSIKAQD